MPREAAPKEAARSLADALLIARLLHAAKGVLPLCRVASAAMRFDDCRTVSATVEDLEDAIHAAEKAEREVA